MWFYSGLFHFKQVYRQLCEAEGELQYQSKTLECSLKGVLHKNILKAFITERHWRALCLPPGIVSLISCRRSFCLNTRVHIPPPNFFFFLKTEWPFSVGAGEKV